MQPTIVHMHIFKNAGTSIDAVFKAFFGNHYASFDLERPGARIGLSEVQDFLKEQPDTRYLTSHQIGFPLPALADRPMFPVYMLRDPFERIPSCYFFERDVQKRVDPDTSIETYVQRHLSSPYITATLGVQCQTLSDLRFNPQLRRDYLQNEGLRQALRNMQSTPVFGLVERFDESVSLFLQYFERYFPGIVEMESQAATRLNVGPGPSDARRDARAFLRDNLSRETFRRVREELRSEEQLLHVARRAFDQRLNLYAKKTV